MTWLELITNAFYETGTIAQGEPVPANLSQFAIDRLNMILDLWSAARRYCYNVSFITFTQVPNLSPHTIGPSGATFTVANRPTRIESASIILTGTNPVVDLPMGIRDDAWWANQQVKSLTSTISTDLYYSPDLPNGSLYFWPVSTQANGVRLEVWVSISQIDSSMLTTTFVLPPAYMYAIMLQLAADMCGPLGTAISPGLGTKIVNATRILQGLNIASPTTTTKEAGQSGKVGQPSWNWLTGDLAGTRGKGQ